MTLQGHHLVLGVTGGIAAYKSCDLVRRMIERGASVQVVMTEAACRFVGAASFTALSGRPALTDPWSGANNGMPHIDLSREASGILIAPATADFMARLVNGQTNDLLSSLCLASDRPIWVAPAMNRQMWSHPATQANIKLLRERGVGIWGPGNGEQACGETGDGRMLEPLEIIAHLEEALQSIERPPTPPLRGLLARRRVVITAGPTFEPIDPVRGITNRSSGQMGYAIAQACAEAGAEVTLVSGPVSLATPMGVNRLNVTTALEMQAAVDRALSSCSTSDVFIGVAAVADWRPIATRPDKIKKETGGSLASLEWIENPDILAGVGTRPPSQRPFTVGFAAEIGQLSGMGQALQAKRERKSADLLVGNIATESLQQSSAELMICSADDTTPWPRREKAVQAAHLVIEIAKRLQEAESN